MNFEKLFQKINSDGHLPIGFIIFAVGSVIHVYHGLDASFVAFTTTVLGFLGGHSWVQANSTQPPAQPPTQPPAGS